MSPSHRRLSLRRACALEPHLSWLHAGAAGKIETSTKGTSKHALRKGGPAQRGTSLRKIDLDESSDKSYADQMREVVADAQRAASGSRDVFLARDALVLAGPTVATKGAAWLWDQLWQRLEPFVGGDDAPGATRDGVAPRSRSCSAK